MKSFEVSLKGIEPGVLMNRFSVEQEAELERTAKKKSNRPSRQEELTRAEYRAPNGELYFPAEWFYQSLLKASGEFQIAGRGKKSYRDFIKSTIVITPDAIGLGTKDYSVDGRAVVIRATKGRVLRYRPHITSWSIDFTITLLDEDLIADDTLHQILVRAGQTVGVGDYRPRYGRFIVEKFKEVPVSKA